MAVAPAMRATLRRTKGDDDHVVDVAQDRNEVRNEVDRKGQVDKQRTEPPPDSDRQRPVDVEAAQQSDDIRDGAPSFPQVDRPGPKGNQSDGERRPQDERGHDHTDDDTNPHGIMLPPRLRPRQPKSEGESHQHRRSVGPRVV